MIYRTEKNVTMLMMRDRSGRNRGLLVPLPIVCHLFSTRKPDQRKLVSNHKFIIATPKNATGMKEQAAQTSNNQPSALSPNQQSPDLQRIVALLLPARPDRANPNLSIQPIQFDQSSNNPDNLFTHLPSTGTRILDLLRQYLIQHTPQSTNQNTNPRPSLQANPAINK